MLYLIGGSPRAGKSVLGQQVAAHLNIGWISTDLLVHLLRVNNEKGVKTEWNATPHAITASAQWFFPYLQQFVWGVTSQAENYLIEGVDFLPAQVKQLADQYELRAIFLGCSQMTLDTFDQFPGRSLGYKRLPEELRRQIVADVPRWSEFIRQECNRFNYPYIDTADSFHDQLLRAKRLLTTTPA